MPLRQGSLKRDVQRLPNDVLGVPQIAPSFAAGTGTVIFDGPGRDEDFVLEQVTGESADRYKFRTSPLRNVALQPAFSRNGATLTTPPPPGGGAGELAPRQPIGPCATALFPTGWSRSTKSCR